MEFYSILVQGLSPLEIKITQFPDEFRLNKTDFFNSVLLSPSTSICHSLILCAYFKNKQALFKYFALLEITYVSYSRQLAVKPVKFHPGAIGKNNFLHSSFLNLKMCLAFTLSENRHTSQNKVPLHTPMEKAFPMLM